MKQKEALEILKMGHNVYLTGAAGSGKTYLLNEYINFLKENDVSVAVTASTGIASTHLGGMTIHSWAGIGINDDLNEWEMDSLLQKSHLAKRFQNTKVLIIDEVSMLHHYRLDLIDKVCRAFRQKDFPFGGMQVILSGDFFQLPPISKNNEGFCFINKANVWNDMDLKVCYLDEQYRQDCDTLTNILNNIRQDNAGENVLAPLRLRYKKQINSEIVPTKLYTHNADIDIINNQQLDLIEGSLKIFEMHTKGNRKLVETLKKSCLAQEELRLKKGAVVMFLKNNPIKKYVNGTLGKVIDFSAGGLPIVKTYDGRIIEVEEESWVIDEDGKIKAELKQIPLRLAWAITIHKSQGMSLDCAEIDLSKSFVEGMGYVALSRVKKIEGLRLMGLNDIALRINKEVSELDKKLLLFSEKAVDELSSFSENEVKKIQETFLDLVSPTKEEKQESLSTYEKTKLLIDEKNSLQEIADKREVTKETIVGHIEKLLESGEKIDIDYIKKGFEKNRLEKILKAFKKTKDKKLTPVKEILGDDFGFDEIRVARLFLE
ncbi:TPA: helicase [Candidatus Campbellbacteria bacterium]|nr:MAG: AAA ATPase [Candidatus Campbellbacteria bacterium GW2011_OD1_34_28]KKP75460.1 MAG: AAA ATPase [Candidatus Campbellbacteria bacterium GW2011_GWD2_35_24]KKP75979.1 MAG: AAA ATPase [Candidatus Campbellbacteria bacterium GW2011_GWC2_35_28]KKP77168.1 MAG: AAA ATPase [Candidatus Campbellbacteria bacterium GW2011_GWC1_35_31]KKP79097.1 MAG: AAA ATPase [Candidatus Campbellbacteria bacterium GW2011_GWD1_35_49]HAP73710.1 helicase [Candidatus Campbellbacteria bacterium]